MADLAIISAPVGRGGTNKFKDVEAVQGLLNMVPVADGGASPVLDIDGWPVSRLLNAIVAFQKRQSIPPGGRVDKQGKTIERLVVLACSPNARPLPAPDPDPAELARTSVMHAMIWAGAGLAAINSVLEAQKSVFKTGWLSLDPSVVIALNAHFKLTPTIAETRLTELLRIVQRNFTRALQTLAKASSSPDQVFVSVSRQRTIAEVSRLAGEPTEPSWVRLEGPRLGSVLPGGHGAA